ncbi:MAG: ferredoxin:protochlorophyllide reductase (ATP-dependent) subunit B, partial [Pseudomonadota bacterium]
HGASAQPTAGDGGSMPPEVAPPDSVGPVWGKDAEQELRKIPFFVRGKARRNTERFAAERGLAEISLDTLYEAKAHYAR